MIESVFPPAALPFLPLTSPPSQHPPHGPSRNTSDVRDGVISVRGRRETGVRSIHVIQGRMMMVLVCAGSVGHWVGHTDCYRFSNGQTPVGDIQPTSTRDGRPTASKRPRHHDTKDIEIESGTVCATSLPCGGTEHSLHWRLDPDHGAAWSWVPCSSGMYGHPPTARNREITASIADEPGTSPQKTAP